MNRTGLYAVAKGHLPSLSPEEFERGFEKAKSWLYCRLAERSVAMTAEGLQRITRLNAMRVSVVINELVEADQVVKIEKSDGKDVYFVRNDKL